jgi:hypothetical protein
MSFFAAPPTLETTDFTRLPEHFRNARFTAWANANRQGRAIDSVLEGPFMWSLRLPLRDGHTERTDRFQGQTGLQGASGQVWLEHA